MVGLQGSDAHRYPDGLDEEAAPTPFTATPTLGTHTAVLGEGHVLYGEPRTPTPPPNDPWTRRAATTVASAYRGKKARQHAAEEGAARKIESIWRGHAARVPIARERLEAAMRIQTHWRRHATRKQFRSLKAAHDRELKAQKKAAKDGAKKDKKGAAGKGSTKGAAAKKTEAKEPEPPSAEASAEPFKLYVDAKGKVTRFRRAEAEAAAAAAAEAAAAAAAEAEAAAAEAEAAEARRRGRPGGSDLGPFSPSADAAAKWDPEAAAVERVYVIRAEVVRTVEAEDPLSPTKMERLRNGAPKDDALAEAKLRERAALMHAPGVQSALARLWEAANTDETDQVIDRAEYGEMHRKIVLALQPQTAPRDALAAADADWAVDAVGGLEQAHLRGNAVDSIDRPKFEMCFFELADLHTESTKAAEYVLFLDDLIALIVARADDGTSTWADDEAIVRGHYESRRAQGMYSTKDNNLPATLSTWRKYWEQRETERRAREAAAAAKNAKAKIDSWGGDRGRVLLKPPGEAAKPPRARKAPKDAFAGRKLGPMRGTMPNLLAEQVFPSEAKRVAWRIRATPTPSAPSRWDTMKGAVRETKLGDPDEIDPKDLPPKPAGEVVRLKSGEWTTSDDPRWIEEQPKGSEQVVALPELAPNGRAVATPSRPPPMLRRADTVQLRPRRNSDGLTEATKSKMRGKPKPKKAPASEPASRVASRPHSPLAITRVAMHGMYATKAGHLGL